MDMPPHVPQEMVQECIAQASHHYGIPKPLIHAVLEVEGGSEGTVHRNNNGTEDLGWAQINTVWLPQLKKYGITRQKLLHDPCVNIGVSAWIMRQNYAQYQDWTSAIAAYNAGSRLKVGMPYARKVIRSWRNRISLSQE